MLSDDDRQALAEIERQLQEDRALARSFGGPAVRHSSWARRGLWALLVTSLMLMVGMAALAVTDAVVESIALAAVAWAGLRVTRTRRDDRVHGRVPDRRR